ncbi:MAG: hypothetical protein ACRD24_04515, partial [Terriglobales bacterium]
MSVVPGTETRATAFRVRSAQPEEAFPQLVTRCALWHVRGSARPGIVLDQLSETARDRISW